MKKLNFVAMAFVTSMFVTSASANGISVGVNIGTPYNGYYGNGYYGNQYANGALGYYTIGVPAAAFVIPLLSVGSTHNHYSHDGWTYDHRHVNNRRYNGPERRKNHK